VANPVHAPQGPPTGRRRAWIGPLIGITVVGLVLLGFIARAVDRHDRYDDGYVAVAVVLGVIPSLVAISMLIRLGARLSEGRATNGFFAATSGAAVIAVVAGWLATTMLGVS
jgi:uncharacterized membrane protein